MNAPEVAIVRRWLNSWRGTGAVIVGMMRQGFDVSPTSDQNGWRATFLHRSHIYHPFTARGAPLREMREVRSPAGRAHRRGRGQADTSILLSPFKLRHYRICNRVEPSRIIRSHV